MRDEAFETQVGNILDSIEALQKGYQLITSKATTQQAQEIESMQQQIAFLEQRERELQDAKERLVGEERGAKGNAWRRKGVFSNCSVRFRPNSDQPRPRFIPRGSARYSFKGHSISCR